MRTLITTPAATQLALTLSLLMVPSLATAGLVNGLSGAEAWYRADSISQGNGTDVSTWTDSSGEGNNASAVATFEPTFNTSVYNGQPAVNFDGINSGEYLNIGSIALSGSSADWSAFAVVKADTAPGNIGFFLNGTGSTKVGPWSGGLFTRVAGGTQTVGSWDIGTNLGIIYFDRNAANLVSIGMDGSTPAAGNTQAGTTTYTQLGKDEATTQQFPGDITEMALFSRQVNQAERIIVENYLKAKYDISLNIGGGATDVYDGDTPGNGDYDLDVTGFGRVDASNIATTGNAAGLRLTENGGLENDEFFLAGHDVVTNSLTPIETNSEIGSGDRWQRVWQLDTNGDSADATIEFDFSDGGVSGSFNASDTFNLLYSSGGSFDWSLLNLAASVTGDAVSFDIPSSQFIDGFYTLGINAAAPVVPEPSTVTLLSLGLLGLVRHKRRRGNQRRVRGCSQQQ